MVLTALSESERAKKQAEYDRNECSDGGDWRDVWVGTAHGTAGSPSSGAGAAIWIVALARATVVARARREEASGICTLKGRERRQEN